MDKRIAKIAEQIGATHKGSLPEVGDGAFGMARLAQVLHGQLAPSTGKRPGRPTDRAWTKRYKVPMSEKTLASLETLSAKLSTSDRKISPMQVAANLLEQGVQAFERQRPATRRKKPTKSRSSGT